MARPVRLRVALAVVLAALHGSIARADPSPWRLQVHRDTTRLLAISVFYGKFWSVGEKGAIMVSDDGKLWARKKPFTDADLSGIAFADASAGCVVGTGGYVAITEDAGEHWIFEKTGVTEDLRGVSFGNRNVGVAVGLKGALLMTYDGGRTWLRKDAGYGEAFMSVVMTSPAEAWVAGERGLILHTLDAGRTWVEYRHPSGRWLYAISFSGNTGWAVGKGGFVLRYMVKTWDEIPLPGPADTLFGVAATSANAVCVVGAGGQVWTTVDAGQTWTRRDAQTTEDLTAVGFAGQTGWAVGPENALQSTIDGGATFATYPLENLPAYTAVAFVDPSTGWTVGRAGLIWGTHDGGETWGQQDAGVRHDMTAVFALRRNLAYATGESVIVKTDNGGLSWRRVWVEPPPSAAELEKPKSQRKPPTILNDIYFFDSRRGWAVGTDGTIMVTTNEGEYWDRMKTPIEKTLYAVWFTSPNDGFVAGEDGQLYLTASGGRRWNSISIGGGGEPLRSIYFLDPDNGWVVGDGGTILRTKDGGKTWREMRLGGSASLRDIWFVDRNLGWLAGDRGVLMKTWDGGETWVSDRPPVMTDYAGLMFVTPELGWAVGERGVILQYNPRKAGL